MKNLDCTLMPLRNHHSFQKPTVHDYTFTKLSPHSHSTSSPRSEYFAVVVSQHSHHGPAEYRKQLHSPAGCFQSPDDVDTCVVEPPTALAHLRAHTYHPLTSHSLPPESDKTPWHLTRPDGRGAPPPRTNFPELYDTPPLLSFRFM